ncbi:MAG: hypothetical protein E3J37_00100 [Anaerolineales bacterium]|nr:MAG: hypothetical protein E3J37_00100 [Anaerolineales bacterium]
MKRRRLLWAAIFTLLVLPGLLLLGGWIKLQIIHSQTTAPRWVNPNEGFDEQQLAELTEQPPGVISPTRAVQIGWHIVDKYASGVELRIKWVAYLDGPTLVEPTFPDGEQRLAWRWEAIVSSDYGFMEAESARVYLDAKTGEPLVLITGIKIIDPTFSRLGMTFITLKPYSSDFYRNNSLAYLQLVVGLTVIVLGVRWLWGTIKTLCDKSSS